MSSSKPFNESKFIYNQALKNSSFKHEQDYQDLNNYNYNNFKNRKGEVISFNPPFCSINIGRISLKLIDKNPLTPHVRRKTECPVGGKYMSKNVVYETTIFSEENVNLKKIYFGISAGSWKQRLYNHGHTFSNRSLKK